MGTISLFTGMILFFASLVYGYANRITHDVDLIIRCNLMQIDWDNIIRIWRDLNTMGWYVTIYSGPIGAPSRVTIERIVNEVDVQRFSFSGDLNTAFMEVAKYAAGDVNYAA